MNDYFCYYIFNIFKVAKLRRIYSKARTQINSGFGSNTSDYGGRFINKDGKPNIRKEGLGFFERISWFHTMLQMRPWKFMTVLMLFFVVINIFFACIYFAIGVEHLGGVRAGNTLEEFGEAFFFSAQTFTTVGYGRISPTGFLDSMLASLEALLGLLYFALASGLFYGRFSRPRAYLRFSKNMVLAPFQGGNAIMLRVAPYKNNSLTDAEAKLIAGLMLDVNGKLTNQFFPLKLEYNSVNSLTLSWTIVHPIDEESPFYNFTEDDFRNTQGEIIVFLKAFDDMFSNTVVGRSSYTMNELVIGAKFIPMFHRSDENGFTILDFDKLDAHQPADITLSQHLAKTS